MSVGGYERITRFGSVIDTREPWAERGELNSRDWLVNCFGAPSAVMIRRDWLNRVGGFRAEFEPAEDWDCFVRLALIRSPMAWVRRSVCQYRQHEGNSTRALDDHLGATLSVLSDIARDPRLPGAFLEFMPRALAWAHASSARAAAGLGENEHVRRALAVVREAARSWNGRRRSFAPSDESFEGLLEPLAGDLAARAPGETESLRTAESWGLTARELRRAMARVEMRQFFAAAERGDRVAAARHLRHGLRRDPRWVTNRGVVGFLLRRPKRPHG
jgi:hypothetical protein